MKKWAPPTTNKMMIRYGIWILLLLNTPLSAEDVYLIIYATDDGYAGHAALAIDNYALFLKETDGDEPYSYDTLKEGTLIIYDLWPTEGINSRNFNKTVQPVYYKGPGKYTGERVTPFSIVHTGIPKIKERFSDGVIRIQTAPYEDEQLKVFLDSLMRVNQDFHAIQFNCTDYARIGLERLTDQLLKAKEYVLIGYTTTPNKLFQVVSKLKNAEVLKDPGDKVKQSFFSEGIIKRLLSNRQQTFYNQEPN
jgi:hypothetical protein